LAVGLADAAIVVVEFDEALAGPADVPVTRAAEVDSGVLFAVAGDGELDVVVVGLWGRREEEVEEDDTERRLSKLSWMPPSSGSGMTASLLLLPRLE
jgi:hypothetical protein